MYTWNKEKENWITVNGARMIWNYIKPDDASHRNENLIGYTFGLNDFAFQKREYGEN